MKDLHFCILRMEQEAVVNEAKTNLVGLNIQSHEDIAIRDTTSLNPIDPFDWTEKRNIETII